MFLDVLLLSNVAESSVSVPVLLQVSRAFLLVPSNERLRFTISTGNRANGQVTRAGVFGLRAAAYRSLSKDNRKDEKRSFQECLRNVISGSSLLHVEPRSRGSLCRMLVSHGTQANTELTRS